MKNRVFALILCALAALLFVAGCSKSPEEKLIGYVEGYAQILLDNENDCSKAGKELRAYIDKNKVEFVSLLTDMMEKAKADPKYKNDELMKQLEDKYKDRFKKNEQKLDEISKKCEDNPELKAANEKLMQALMPILLAGLADAMKDAANAPADDAPAADPAPAGDAPAAE